MSSAIEDDDDFKLLDNPHGTERPSDLRKRAKYFEQSRDEWKKRNAEKRIEKQVLMTKNSRLEQRLKKQEEKTLLLEKKLGRAEKQVEILEQENKTKNEEIEILKKKLRY